MAWRESLEVSLTRRDGRQRKTTDTHALQVLANYGYTKEQAGLYYDLQQTGVPSSLPLTAAENFLRESRAIVETVFGGLRSKEKGDASQDELRDKLAQLKLSNQAVWDREHAREVRVVLLCPSNPLSLSRVTMVYPFSDGALSLFRSLSA
jgi:hypothetical protein